MMTSTTETAPDLSVVKATGYQGFGSFHSDNVEEIIAIPAALYTPPPLPHGLTPADIFQLVRGELESTEVDGSAKDFLVPPFGASMRTHFYLDASWNFINHGAFGAACRVAMLASQRWSVYCERQPLRLIDRELFPYIASVIRQVAQLIHAPPQNVVFLPNATYGLNAAINSVSLGKGDVVFMLDVGYGSVKKMVQDVCDRTGAVFLQHKIRMPLTDTADLMQQVTEAMPLNTKLAIFDHVTSNTALVLPVKELVRAARSVGAQVLIDGAHGMQNIDIDMIDIGADWYITNCHKWLCSTKGVAVMYAGDSVRAQTKPRIISHGYGAGYTSNFIWDGCRDYGGILAMDALLAWWQRVDHGRAREYCRSLLREAVATLTSMWGTTTHAPLSFYTNMACVELPLQALPPGACEMDADGSVRFCCTSLHGKMVQDALHYACSTEVPVKTLDNKLYVRISAAIYNSIDQYEQLGKSILNLSWERKPTATSNI